MRKVCLIVTDAISFNILYRGQLEYFNSLGNFEFTLICGGDNEDIKCLKNRDVGKVVVMPLFRKPNPYFDLKVLLQLTKFLMLNKFDLVVYSTPKALLIGSLASFISGQPNRLAIVQGRVYENYTGTKRKIFTALDKLSLGLSSKTVFVSDSLRNLYLDEHIISSANSLVVNSGSANGVDTQKFIPNTDKANDLFNILVIGRICRDKGIKDLSEIVKNIQDMPVKLTIVGRVEDSQSEQNLQHLKTNYKFVEHLDFTPNPVQYFQNADLHLFLTYREGFGNVAIEAASCNVPTFAYDVVGVKDSVKENVSGLRFKFHDTDAVSQAIKAAIEDKSKFKEQFSHAREWAIQNFDQKTVWENYLQFYNQMMDK
jgi:glycosyltransferase involved in cell wall biosynthesis